MSKTKPRNKFTRTERVVIRSVRDRVRSLLDGKAHGSCGGCAAPIGSNIFVESWVLPYLDALVEHTEGREKLPDWMGGYY